MNFRDIAREIVMAAANPTYVSVTTMKLSLQTYFIVTKSDTSIDCATLGNH